jgi:hypothetical protein
MKIKVFKMNDCDYYAGETLKDCVEECARDSGESVHDILEEPVEELTLDELNDLTFIEDDEPEKFCSFRQHLDELIVEGAVFPRIFASTEY